MKERVLRHPLFLLQFFNFFSKQMDTGLYKKAYDDIKVRVPKGNNEKYKTLAESKGKSLNQLIIDLLDAEITK